MVKILNQAFIIKYNGLARELSLEVGIEEPLVTKAKADFRTIWDTGATNTVISHKVVEFLKLKPISKVRMAGVNGVSEANVYLINLYLPNKVRIKSLNVAEAKLSNCDVLIGMDIILLGDMAVSNFEKKTQFTFSFPPHYKKPDYVERSNKLNERLLKNK